MIRVQAILKEHDTRFGVKETIVDSYLVEEAQADKALEMAMKKHRNSYSYTYIKFDVENKQIILKTEENKYH